MVNFEYTQILLKEVMTVLGLKQILKNKMDDDRSFATKMAKLLGYANPTGLYKFLNNGETEFKDVQKLIIAVQDGASNFDEFNIMDQYIRTLNPNNKLARQCLEYAKINKLETLFNELLVRLENASNAGSKEIAAVYRIDNLAEYGELKPFEAIEKLDRMKLKSIESKVYAFIAKFYLYNDLGMINMMTNLCPIIEEMVNSMDESYVKKSYYGRLLLLSTEIKLYNNRVEEVRKIESEVNDMNDTIQSMLNVHIGNSYMFENFDKSNKHLSQALDMATRNNNSNGMTQSKRSLNFLLSYWGKQALYLDENSTHISDIHEVAFSKIKTNQVSDGIKILERIDKDALTNRQLGFHYFYWGMATNEIEYFRKSIMHFNMCNEKFYKTPVLIELKRLGEDESILRVFAV